MQNAFQTKFNINTIQDVFRQKNIKNSSQNSSAQFKDTLQPENKTGNKKKKSAIIGSMMLLGILGAAFVLHNKKTAKIKKSANENINSATEAMEEIIPEKIKTIKKLAEDIFLEDFSTEEAIKIQEKYKQISKIDNKEKLADVLFAELKKDFQLQNIPIKFDRNYSGKMHKFQNGTTSRTVGLHTGTISYAEFLDKLQKENSELLNDLKPVAGSNLLSIKPGSKLEKEILKTLGKTEHEIKLAADLNTADIIEIMTHEFRHEKQFLLQYQTSTKNELEEVQSCIWKNKMKQIKERVENNTASEEDVRIFNLMKNYMEKNKDCSYEDLLNILAPYDRINNINTQLNMQNRYYYYKDLGIEHINENHKNYKFGRKVLESEYYRDADSSFENYKNQFIEADARKTGENMTKLINL